MNSAIDSSETNAATTSIDTVRQSLEMMPRARDLGSAALELCVPKTRKVMSGANFVFAVRSAVESIAAWSGDTILSEEVQAFCNVTDDELLELQRAQRFSGVQVMQWRGEMKLQVYEARRTSLR